jgi:hypothetical protein
MSTFFHLVPITPSSVWDVVKISELKAHSNATLMFDFRNKLVGQMIGPIRVPV